jgi:hypothetical protein
MVELFLAKEGIGVRFPLAAPIKKVSACLMLFLLGWLNAESKIDLNVLGAHLSRRGLPQRNSTNPAWRDEESSVR